jgi:TPR repeat protein
MMHRLLCVLVLFCVLPVQAQTLEEGLKAYESGKHADAARILTPFAKQGTSSAQHRVGLMYFYGQGVPEDEKQAVFWLRKAAEQGNVDAMFEMGNAFLLGNQAAKLVADPDREAALWYFQAASAGHAVAQYHLGLLFLAGKGVVQSQKEAVTWFNKAAAQGHAEAKRAAGQVVGK